MTPAYGDGAAGIGRQLTRRAFLRGTGFTLAGTSFLLSGVAPAKAADVAVTEADSVYERLAPFLLALGSSAGLGSELRSIDQTVLIALTDPDLNLFLELHPDAPAEVARTSAAGPDVIVRMATATAEDLFAGQDNWFAATARGSVTITGPVDRLRAIAPRVQFASPVVYQAAAVPESATQAAGR